jgi:hypothetical protein
MKEPIRMRESHELPSALRDAFGALSRDAPSEETVLRVQRALSALPAPVPGAAAAGMLGVSKLLVVVTLIAGALATAVVLTRRPVAPAAERASDTIPASAPSARAPAEAVRALQADAPSPGATRVGEPAAEPSARMGQVAQARDDKSDLVPPLSAQPPGSARAAGAARFAPRTPRARAPSQPSSAQRALGDQRSPQSRDEAPPSADPGTSAPAAAALAEDQVPSAPPVLVASAQAGEAQRLAQCKRLALRDPEQALREVEALAQQLPNGALVQERELLAIRLHERLGHQAIAAELRQRFLARYPSSVYRRALLP